MKKIRLEESDCIEISRADGTRLYICDDSIRELYHVFSDSPFTISPRSDNSIFLKPEITASVRRNKANTV